jgi:hypothetical protein
MLGSVASAWETTTKSAVRGSHAVARLTRVLAALAGPGLFLTACPSPSTYTVPRTLERGDLQFVLAAEAYGYTGNAPTVLTSSGSTSSLRVTTVTPQPPTIGFRYGVIDGLEVGARIPHLDSLAADLKGRLLRGTLDFALDPGFQIMDITATTAAPTQHVGVLDLHAPLLAGLNVSDGLTLITSLGLMYSAATGVPNGGFAAEASGAQTGAWGRFALGVDIHPSEKIAWHPEVTCMVGLGSIQGVGCTAGLAVLAGAQPSYADLANDPTR